MGVGGGREENKILPKIWKNFRRVPDNVPDTVLYFDLVLERVVYSLAPPPHRNTTQGQSGIELSKEQIESDEFGQKRQMLEL